MNVIVRKTGGFRKDEVLNKHNIYFSNDDGRYTNLYTCMCCLDVFIRFQDSIDEPDNGETIADVHIDLLKHFLKHLRKNSNRYTLNVDHIIQFLEKEIKDRKKQ